MKRKFTSLSGYVPLVHLIPRFTSRFYSGRPRGMQKARSISEESYTVIDCKQWLESRDIRFKRYSGRMYVFSFRCLLYRPQARWNSGLSRMDAHSTSGRWQPATYLEEFPDWEVDGFDYARYAWVYLCLRSLLMAQLMDMLQATTTVMSLM
jgi:hypothetical protein